MNFSFYRADAAYCDFLRKTDPCVPYTMEQKEQRPFVGIVFSINGTSYYAPLTSPKPKHRQMKNQVDFLKINGGTWGAINFNNMIPIHTASLTKIEMKITPADNKAEQDYKNLLANQLSWCNANKDKIKKQAADIYTLVVGGKAWESLTRRCCDFALDEKQYLLYCKQNSLEIKQVPPSQADQGRAEPGSGGHER